MRFAFRLAAQLGIVDPIRDILGRIDADLFALWAAFLDLEPLAADRADVRDAFHTSVIVNAWLPDEAEPIDVETLVVPWQDAAESEPETPEQQALREVSHILTHFG